MPVSYTHLDYKQALYEAPCTLNDTWGYSRFDHNWKTPAKLMRLLLKINSRGGNYLLNIGPTADGVVPQESVAILDQIGAFLAKNGESIYATRVVDQYAYCLLYTSTRPPLRCSTRRGSQTRHRRTGMRRLQCADDSSPAGFQASGSLRARLPDT